MSNDQNQKDISASAGSEESNRIFEIALSLVPALDALAHKYGLSSDTAHEVMMEAAKRVVELKASPQDPPKPIINLPAYLFSIGRNLVFEEIRRRRDEVQLDGADNVGAEPNVPIETQILLTEIVQRMNSRARAIFQYRRMGYDYGEIAREFKRMGYRATASSLRSEFSKATKRIIKELEIATS